MPEEVLTKTGNEASAEPEGASGAEPWTGIVYKDGDKKQATALVWNGEEFPLLPMDAADLALAKKRLLELRGNPVQAIRPELESLSDRPDLQRMLLEVAFDRAQSRGAGSKVTDQQAAEWLQRDDDGVFFKAWLTLRKTRPDITEEFSMAVMQDISVAEATRAAQEEAAKKQRAEEKAQAQAQAEAEAEAAKRPQQPPRPARRK